MTRALGFASTAVAAAHVFVEHLGDEDVRVEGDDGHHLQRVRRLHAGESVTASDGRGAWRVCTIAEVEDGRLRLVPAGPITLEPELVPRLVVAFAPAKGDQAGAVVHQLVELGVDAVMPITLRRSVVRWDGARGDRARARLGRVIREAAMQSRRARLPELLDERPLSDLARHPGLLVADPGGRPAAGLVPPVGGEWLVLVGPEGGLDQGEHALLAPGARLAVGPHVLRAVTAPVAAAAALVGFRSRVPSDSS
ncbi:MAG: RsmE family RNA methyltransferase [Acidimicrobiia bacterium]